MMTNVVLIDAGRSAVIPDDPGLPETPIGLAEDVIQALLRRARLRRSEITELFLADPRCLSTGCSTSEVGWSFDLPPLGLTTTVCMSSSLSMTQAVRAIEKNPEIVAVVAATDFGMRSLWNGDRSAELDRQQHTARAVAVWWDVAHDEMASWARLSCTRAEECSAAGDFDDEIVSTTPGYLADCYHNPDTSDSLGGRADMAQPARGTSAIILASEPNAMNLGLRFRARLHATFAIRSCADSGIAPPSSDAVDQLLASCGSNLRGLDQLEVPEHYAVTPVAWIKETGISDVFVNPRGGDLAFGHLPRSGHLRSLVTMLNSLEATGGRTGAVIASDADRTTAFVLSRR